MVKGRNPGIKVPGLHEAHPSVRKAFQQIITKLGQKSSPVFDNLIIGGDLTVGGELLVTGGLTVGGDLTLSGLTASRLVATDANKTLESTDAVSWIAGTSNQVIVTDDTDGTVTLSTPQDIDTAADVTFNSLTLTDDLTVGGDITLNNLSASRLVSTDANKALESSDAASWISGTANRVTVADDGDGTVTLSGPQDIHTGASPTFTDLTLSAPVNIYSLSHDLFADYVADEHIDWTGTTEDLVTSGDVQAATAKFGDVAGGNYFEIESDGTWVKHGDATTWDDIRVPSQNTKTNPSKAEPNFEVFTDGLYCWKFDTSNADDESVHFMMQIPHSWKVGTDLEAHLHWSPDSTNTGNVVWEFEYVIQSIDGTFAGTATNLTVTDAADGTALKHQITELGAIDGSSLGISSMLIGRLTRMSSSDAADTYTGNACFLEIDFHYQVDTAGSREEYVK